MSITEISTQRLRDSKDEMLSLATRGQVTVGFIDQIFKVDEELERRELDPEKYM